MPRSADNDLHRLRWQWQTLHRRHCNW